MIYVDLYWCMLIYVDLCWFMLICYDLCWCIWMYVYLYWFMLIYVDLCWFMLIYVDLCWFVIIYVDLCWCMLIYVDLCWFMLICNDLCWFIAIYVDLASCANVAALSPPGLNFWNWPPPQKPIIFLILLFMKSLIPSLGANFADLQIWSCLANVDPGNICWFMSIYIDLRRFILILVLAYPSFS